MSHKANGHKLVAIEAPRVILLLPVPEEEMQEASEASGIRHILRKVKEEPLSGKIIYRRY